MEFVLNDFTLKSVKYLFTWSTERIDRVFRIVLLAVGDWSLQTWDFPYSLCKVFFTLKKSVFSQTLQKGSVGVKKLLNELKCRKML